MNRIILLGALIVISSGSAHTVRVDFDHAVHFSSYKTYRWVVSAENQSQHALFPNQIMEQRIADLFQEALACHGLKRVTTGGDLLISSHMIVTEQQQFITLGNDQAGWYSGWGWGGGPWPGGYATTTVETFYEGTLVLDMVDANSGKMVFEGTSTQSVSSRPNKNIEKLAKAAVKIMAKYPPQN